MRVSEFFKLNLSQAVLDFVDIRIDTDTKLFLDPWSFAITDTPWCDECHQIANDFFQEVLNALVRGDRAAAEQLVFPLREDNRTRLGYSNDNPQGRGLGSQRAAPFLDALEQSDAFKTGRVQDIESAALLVDHIGLDIVSDMLTNVLHEKLVEYTQQQCRIYGIKTAKQVKMLTWRPGSGWLEITAALPSDGHRSILLVPRAVLRKDLTLNASQFLRFVEDAYDVGNPTATTSLEKMLQVPHKDKKKRHVHRKKLLDALTQKQSLKSAMAKITDIDPSVLEEYKDSARRNGSVLRPEDIEGAQRDPHEIDFEAVANEVKSAAANVQEVGDFGHQVLNGMISIVHPTLQHPRLPGEPVNGFASYVFANIGDRGVFEEVRRNSKQPNVIVLAAAAPLTEVMLSGIDVRSVLKANQSGLAIVVGPTINRDVHKNRLKFVNKGVFPVSAAELSEAIEAEGAEVGAGIAYLEQLVAP